MLCVSVLSLCLEDAQSMVALQNSGCLQHLFSHITESSSPEMKKHSAKALAKAALNRKPSTILVATYYCQQLETGVHLSTAMIIEVLSSISHFS